MEIQHEAFDPAGRAALTMLYALQRWTHQREIMQAANLFESSDLNDVDIALKAHGIDRDIEKLLVQFAETGVAA